MLAHFYPSTVTFQMEYYDKEKLVAFGFVDRSGQALNSVYFVFDPEEKKRSLGIYGCLQELALTKYWSKQFYYLGYWVPGNGPMDYKSQFSPCEHYVWEKLLWEKFKKDELLAL